MTAVDGSTTYDSWQDLWQTLKAAMDSEAADVQPQFFTPVVNAADYNSVDLQTPSARRARRGNAIRANIPTTKRRETRLETSCRKNTTACGG